MFSITKVTGLPPEAVAPGGRAQPPANGYVVVVTTEGTEDERAKARPHLRLVQD